MVSSNLLHGAQDTMVEHLPKAIKMKRRPRQTLIRNLRYLMDKYDYSGNAIAKKAGVSEKTVSNMLNDRHNVTLDSVQKVAEVFGLDSWHLILPNLPVDLIDTGVGDRLLNNYSNSSQEGRNLIELISDRESSHSK